MTFNIKVEKIQKDAKNPFFKSRYASLSNILEAIQIPLAESGLAFTQFPDTDHSLTTILMHAESGEWMQATYKTAPVPEYSKEKDSAGAVVYRGGAYVSPQAVGSAITYARRYALAAVLGLNIDDDDDGNSASGTSQKIHDQPVDDKPWLNENTPEFNGAVEKMRAGKSSIDALKKFFKISKAIEAKLKEQSTLQNAN